MLFGFFVFADSLQVKLHLLSYIWNQRSKRLTLFVSNVRGLDFMLYLRALIACIGMAVPCLFLTSCQSWHAGNANATDRGPEKIQRVVEEKMKQQREQLDGATRWEDFKKEAYQSQEDLRNTRKKMNEEHKRMEEATALLEQGPLLLPQCLAFSLEFNNQIQSERAEIRSVGGDALVARSRFLPQVNYFFDYDNQDDLGRSQQWGHGVRFNQTLFEFGKDSPEDITLRATQRNALFTYENTVSRLLSDVRRRFFTVLLRQQQIEQRRELLEEFKIRYDQVQQLEKARRVLETDTLTARLNVLNEEARINSLEKELFRQKQDLLRSLGFPVGIQAFQLQGEVESFQVPIEEAVNIALLRSTEVAQARATLAEQSRTARQVLVEHFPDVNFEGGWGDRESAAGLELNSSDGLYELSAFGEVSDEDPTRARANGSGFLQDDDRGWFASVSVDLPIFEGMRVSGRYLKQRELLNKARYDLWDQLDLVENDVRKFYQTILEERKELELRQETVLISKERLRVQERLKDLGEISDNQLETFRTRFFQDQDAYFNQQIRLIDVQERLRQVMRFFEESVVSEPTETDENL